MTEAPNSTAYDKPPITEAVVEVRTDQLLDARELERCRERFKRQYAKVEVQNEVNVLVADTGTVSHAVKIIGYKLTAASAVDVLILQPGVLGTIRLAPYQGFDSLLAVAKENFETFTKIAGRRRISRLAIRTINRIDVPNKVFAQAGSWSAFVKVQPSLPPEVAVAPQAYYINVQAPYAAGGGVKLNLQTGPVNTVLLDHQSLQLDVDVSYEGEIPARIDEMWDKFSELRLTKNTIFEACITDAARKLFE